MNVITQLRQTSGLTQREFADRTGSSQPTVAQYESGKKSPTERTIRRMGAARGLELQVQWVPTMTREDRRSLVYNEAIIVKMLEEPDRVLAHARKNIERWLDARPHAQKLLHRWSLWLELPVDDLRMLMLDPCLQARDMRQVSPFAGLLDASERTQVLKQFQREEAA